MGCTNTKPQQKHQQSDPKSQKYQEKTEQTTQASVSNIYEEVSKHSQESLLQKAQFLESQNLQDLIRLEKKKHSENYNVEIVVSTIFSKIGVQKYSEILWILKGLYEYTEEIRSSSIKMSHINPILRDFFDKLEVVYLEIVFSNDKSLQSKYGKTAVDIIEILIIIIQLNNYFHKDQSINPQEWYGELINEKLEFQRLYTLFASIREKSGIFQQQQGLNNYNQRKSVSNFPKLEEIGGQMKQFQQQQSLRVKQQQEKKEQQQLQAQKEWNKQEVEKYVSGEWKKLCDTVMDNQYEYIMEQVKKQQMTVGNGESNNNHLFVGVNPQLVNYQESGDKRFSITQEQADEANSEYSILADEIIHCINDCRLYEMNNVNKKKVNTKKHVKQQVNCQ